MYKRMESLWNFVSQRVRENNLISEALNAYLELERVSEHQHKAIDEQSERIGKLGKEVAALAKRLAGREKP